MLHLPVRRLMTSPVETIGSAAPLARARDRMIGRRVSALPVIDPDGEARGVVTRTDLLRVGRAAATEEETLVFDGREVGSVATGPILTVPVDADVARAAARFLEEHVHRVFVEDGGRIVGVLSGRDLSAAVAGRSLGTPISTVMSAPVEALDAREPLGEAVDRLLEGGISSLAVHRDGQPIGIFSRHRALQSAELPPRTPVGALMRLRPLRLPASTSVTEAASLAIAQDVRQILVEDDGSLRPTERPEGPPPRPLGGILGIVTCTDLAGAVIVASP